jgi:aspartate kinase
MQVFKFGGASVKDAESFRNVINILQGQSNLVVVISALGKTTNKLEQTVDAFFGDENWQEKLQLVRAEHKQVFEELFEITDEEQVQTLQKIFTYVELYLNNAKGKEYDEVYDQVVSVGELLSSKILNFLLTSFGIKNQWIDIRKILKTNECFKKAELNWDVSKSNVHGAFKDENLYVTQGFIAGTSENRMTTLGREGSDFSAAILANLLNAKSLTVWKDVEGVLNADPRYFNHPKLLSHISYKEAIELSYYGATIIHPKTLKPLENKSIPLLVKSFLNPEMDGTTINSDQNNDDHLPIYIYKPQQVLITLSKKDYGFLNETDISVVFNTLAQFKLEANLIQNSALNFSICLDLDSRKIEPLIETFQRNFKTLYNTNLELLTIRHYTESSTEDLLKSHEVIVEQKTRSTLKLLLRSNNE